MQRVLRSAVLLLLVLAASCVSKTSKDGTRAKRKTPKAPFGASFGLVCEDMELGPSMIIMLIIAPSIIFNRL